MADDNDQWGCPACTLMNALTAEACEACGATSPLVLESYEAEERANATANGNASKRGNPAQATSRGRGGSNDSADSARSEEIASELDPWAQAECEWANVEAHQEEHPSPKNKNKRK